MIKPKKQTSKGFTLVELLVVIVMIAALAAIVFTIARKGMDKANTAGCINNMRQIGLALTSYQSENQGYPSNKGTTWDRAILPNLGYDGPKNLAGGGPFSKSQWPELQGIVDIFACPSDKKPRSSSTFKRSYAIVPWTTNHSDGTSFRGWKDREYNKGVPLSIVQDPERAALLVEWHAGTEGIANVCGSGGHAFHDQGGPLGNGLEVHGHRQIVLFADVHTELMPQIPGPKFVEKYWPGKLDSVN